jgi:hypothetical protein
METYEPISSAGEKMKCGRITEMNSLVSRVESLQPGQECGPSENDMTFARPGCNGARALSGKFDQRSGLVEEASAIKNNSFNNKDNVLELSRVFTPNIFAHVQSLKGNVHKSTFPDGYPFWRFDFRAVTLDD